MGAGLLVGLAVLCICLRRKKHANSSDLPTNASNQPGFIHRFMGVSRQPAAGHAYLNKAGQTQSAQQLASATAAYNGVKVYSTTRPPSATTTIGPLTAERSLQGCTSSQGSVTDSGGFGLTAAAVTAAGAAGVGSGASVGAVSRSTSRGDLTVGFTGEEVESRLSDLEYIVTHKLLPAVNASNLEAGTLATLSLGQEVVGVGAHAVGCCTDARNACRGRHNLRVSVAKKAQYVLSSMCSSRSGHQVVSNAAAAITCSPRCSPGCLCALTHFSLATFVLAVACRPHSCLVGCWH